MEALTPTGPDGSYRPAHAEPGGQLIDLGAAPKPATTRVVLERDLSPFDRLAPDARRRLLVRVLCELVAYDAPPEAAQATERLAG